MGVHIPAIYTVYPRQSQPIHFSSGLEVTDFLSQLTDWENPAADGICMCTCRNLWHQGLLEKICKGAKIKGLEFSCMSPSYVCLCDDELKAAQEGITYLVNLLGSGLPDLGKWEDEGVKDFRYCRGSIPTVRDADDPERYLQAFKQAQVKFYIDSESWGFEASQSFCSHIKTLHSKINEAVKQDAFFIYVLPEY